MKSILTSFAKNQSFIFKIFLFILSTVLIIYLLPKGGQFKYNFQKGKPWQYENLYAPFSFTIKKNNEEIEEEKKHLREAAMPYFEIDTSKIAEVKNLYNNFYKKKDTIDIVTEIDLKTKDVGLRILDEIYTYGLINENYSFDSDKLIYLKNGNEIQKLSYKQLVYIGDLEPIIKNKVEEYLILDSELFLTELITSVVLSNVILNSELTELTIKTKIESINPNRGVIDKGSRIIAKGEVVEGNKFQILSSYKAVFESQIWSKSNFYWLFLGYSLLISLVFLMLFLFLKNYRLEIYNNTTKVAFILFNIITMIFLTTLVVKYDAKLVYITPLCILPLVLKTFFDARLGLFVHVLTILLLGFIVPNSFEFLFLQTIAGMVTILTVSELYKRANLFISVGQITFIYILGYFAFFIIQEGNIELIQWDYFGYFVLCGLLTLFSFPLIYIYEKMFGLVSDVSLLELSDTNSKLLKELSNKAPGTFHHSLNVANLAEAAANEIGANAMLTRVGALYHDIGKMVNPTYFTENQMSSINSHDELDPKESAEIIIEHVINGIEIAKKNNLPDRIIDFIRTHHGTSLVYYFYSKENEKLGIALKEEFSYPGPTPFSKETAILMMADSVEAASKSLKEPTSSMLDNFVEKIIDGQLNQGQFLNANITLKEIQRIKKVLKKKLNNMYHLRIEYPE
ncbi:MAG: HDIG domain-containing protein [Flavobacteriaceae bacterium]|jgi:cyclic-di-AMP phosphodiesterase PgpH|nr:HDIG domain-containing protein [Flavobacteriaceae bacterium]